MQSSYKNKKKYKTRKNEEKRGKTRKNEEKLLLFIVSMLFVSIMATYFNIAYNDLQCQSMNFGNESYSDYFFFGDVRAFMTVVSICSNVIQIID